MAVIQISRDPFAREALVRRTLDKRYESTTGTKCIECGQRARFEYGVQEDGGREYWNSYAYCGIDCYRAYKA